MKHPIRYLFAALLFAPLSVAWAQTTVNDHHPLASGGRVEISNVAGKVNIRGWDRNDVQWSGTLGEGQTLEVRKSANRVQVKVVYPRNNHNSSGAQLELRVPRSAELVATTVSANIDVADVDLRRLQAQTVSGGIVAAGRTAESTLTTVSGKVRSQLTTPRLEARTVSGSIDASGATGGDVSAETVSGAVRLDLSTVQRLSVESVSGNLGVRSGGLAPGGRIDLQTVSGPVTLNLPADSSAQLRVNSFNGRIKSDAGQVERPRYGPGSSLNTRIGSGDGDISIKSHTGNVSVQLGRR